MDSSHHRSRLSGVFRRRSSRSLHSHQPFTNDGEETSRASTASPARDLFGRIRKASSRSRLGKQQSTVLDTTRHSSREVLDGARSSDEFFSKTGKGSVGDAIPMAEVSWDRAGHDADVLEGMMPLSDGLDSDARLEEPPQKMAQVDWNVDPSGRYESVVTFDSHKAAEGTASCLSSLDGSMGTNGTNPSLLHGGDVQNRGIPMSDKSLVLHLTSAPDDLVSREFYLPKLYLPGSEHNDDKWPLRGDDPLALENILRCWQVNFLNSVHIKTPKGLVEARKCGLLFLLAKGMRRWRRTEKLPSFRTKSCQVALRIWSRTCKAIIRSVREQNRKGVSMGVKPAILEDKTSKLARSLSSATGATEASSSRSRPSLRSLTLSSHDATASTQRSNREVLAGMRSTVSSMIEGSRETMVKGGPRDQRTGQSHQSSQVASPASAVAAPRSRESLMDETLPDMKVHPSSSRSTTGPSFARRSKASKARSSRSLAESSRSRNRRSGSMHADLLEIHRSRSNPSLDRPRKSCLKTYQSDEFSVRSKHSAVSFADVQFREYERVLSDNPSVSEGPAIGIGWKYAEDVKFTVDAYESSRPPRRIKDEFLMPARVRRALLLEEYNYPYSQLRRAVSESDRVKAKRRQLAHRPHAVERADELVEASRRRIRRLRNGISKAGEQEQLWDKAREWFRNKESAPELRTNASPVYERYGSDLSRD